MTALLEPQAALEQACVDLMRASTTEGGLGLDRTQCGRAYDGQPPPACGLLYVAVWGRGDRGSVRQHNAAVEEEQSVMVTVTVRCSQLPYDRWVEARDLLERWVNRVINLIAKDAYDYRATRRAATLAGYDQGVSTAQPIGWVEGLKYEDCGAVDEVGPSWFQSESESDMAASVGLAQTLRFGGNKRVRNLASL